MTIKQQGGVFGRNPTFNDVTVEGTLTTSGAQSVDELNVDNVNINGNTIKATDTNGNLIINPDGTTGVVLTSLTRTGITQRTLNKTMNTWGGQGNGVGFENTARYEITAGNDTVKAFIAAGYNSAGKYPNVGAVGTTSNHPLAIHINDNKVAEFTTSGNLAFNNGLGIDFSATSGTGTSELFDDYEEGTWTPVVTDGTNTSTPLYAEGHYRKIGSQVTVYIALTNMNTITASLSGSISITGLPYASKTSLPSLMSYVGTVKYTNMSAAPLLSIYYNGSTSVGTGITAANITTDTADLYSVITYLTN